MRGLFLLPFLVFFNSCSTYLTEKGQRLMVVEGNAVGTVSDCTRLGPVRGFAKSGWGNDVGLNQAYNDAINRAAEYEEADTIVIASTNRQFNGGSVDGIAYNCKSQKKSIVELHESKRFNNVEIVKKAKKCQEKGGVWINNICQLDIE